MSIVDEMIVRYYKLLTSLPLKDIAKVKKQLTEGMNPRDAKMHLARVLITHYYNDQAAQKAEEYFVNTFSKKETPSEMSEVKMAGKDIIAVLVETKLCKSNSDARRNIDGGGVKVNDKKVDSYELKVKSGDVVQKGKRHFVKIK